VHREGADALSLAEPVQLHGKEHIGRLGLAIGLPPVVAAMEEVGIGEIHLSALVAPGGERHHPRPPRAPQRGPEPRRELEMPQVVGGELGFIAPRIPLEGRGHDAGVVDEHVQGPPRGQELGRIGVDGPGVEQVQLAQFHAGEGAKRPTGLVGVAGRHEHGRPGLDQGPGRLQAEAGGAARDDGDLALQADPAQGLSGRGSGPETGADRRLGTRHGLAPRIAVSRVGWI